MLGEGIIGHTGFVGSHLLKQRSFSNLYNTSNISDIIGHSFDTLICAAAPGSMFTANRDAESDLAQIDSLITTLAKVKARYFILISSIAVLKDFANGDEEDTKAFQQDFAYGRHRRKLELFVEEKFEKSLVVRLPALFGEGLRKNFIFDLLNPMPSMLTRSKLDGLSNVLDLELFELLNELYTFDPITGMMKLDRRALEDHNAHKKLVAEAIEQGFSAMQFHNPETTFQYYNMSKLCSDIEVAIQANISHVHLATEPVKASIIHERLTGRAMPDTGARIHREDMRTAFAKLWGKQGPYLEDSEDVLEQLQLFYEKEKKM